MPSVALLCHHMMLAQIFWINRLEFPSSFYFQSDYVTNKNALHQSVHATVFLPPPPRKVTLLHTALKLQPPRATMSAVFGVMSDWPVQLEGECLAQWHLRWKAFRMVSSSPEKNSSHKPMPSTSTLLQHPISIWLHKSTRNCVTSNWMMCVNCE